MSLHLVTGYAGTPHITAADHGSLNASIWGESDYVTANGQKLSASIISNNQVRIADGDIVMQGRHIRIPKGSYEDVVIENGTQGMNRNDLIVVRYTKNAESGIESVDLAVIKGTETTDTAVDPEYTTGDILSGDCVLHEMPLYRVPLTGLTVGTLVPLFNTAKPFLQKVLLWTNAKPNSPFESQTLREDVLGTNFSQYDEIQVEFRITDSSDFYTFANFVKGHSSRHIVFAKQTTDAVDTIIIDRTVTMYNSTVYFGGGTQKTLIGKSFSNNTGALIPTRIWGIKGV